MSSTTLVERYHMGKVLNIINVGQKCAKLYMDINVLVL